MFSVPGAQLGVQSAELRCAFGQRASANLCQKFPQKMILPYGLWEISKLCFDLIFSGSVAAHYGNGNIRGEMLILLIQLHHRTDDLGCLKCRAMGLGREADSQ